MPPATSPIQSIGTSKSFTWPTLFWELLLPLIIFAARSVRVLTRSDVPFDTKYHYLPFARHILENAHAFWSSEMSLRAAPGIAVYMALANADVMVIKMWNLGLALGSVVLLFHISQRLAGNIAASTTAWLMALSPLFVNLSILPQVEGLTFFLMTLWLWATAWCLDRETVGPPLVVLILLAGLALAALTFTRATLMYWTPALALLCIAAYLLPNRSGRNVLWLRIAIIHCIALALTGTYMLRNADQFGKPVIAAGSGAALYFGNLSPTHGQEPPYFGLAHDQHFITQDTDHLTLKGDERLSRVVKVILANRPWLQTAELYLQKTGSLLFFSKSHLLNYSDRSWRCLLIVMGLAGLWFGRCKPTVLLTGALAMYMLAVHVPVLYSQRYSVGALEIELMLLAGVGFGLILQHKYRWRVLTATLALLISSAIIGAVHQRYTQPMILDTKIVPFEVLRESSIDKVETTGFESNPFKAPASLTSDMVRISWRDNFPVIGGYTVFDLEIKQLKGECTKAWLSFTDRSGTTRGDFVNIKSLRDGQDFSWGMAHIASPIAGGKIDISMQCSQGAQMHLRGMRLLEGTPGRHFLQLSNNL